MPQGRKARREEIEARLEHAEKTLAAMRNSARGHSHALLLHLEREVHASKKELALLDAQPAVSGSANASGASQL
jgi:ribosomal protein L29